MNGFNLYLRFIRLNFLANLQYKGWPLQMAMVLFTVISDPIAVFLLFSRFGSIGAWNTERVMLVYGLAVTAFGLAETFSRGYDYFPWHIRTGEFDRILLRPRSTFVQIIGARFHIHRLSRVVGGLFMIGWALARLDITLTAPRTMLLIFALVGGYATYTGVFVISAAISFWTINALDWIYIFTNISYQITKCPPQLLPTWLKNTFLYIMPMLVFAYWPAAAIGGWDGVSPALGWLALPAGLAFLAIAIMVWRIGVRHYTSTGS